MGESQDSQQRRWFPFAFFGRVNEHKRKKKKGKKGKRDRTAAAAARLDMADVKHRGEENAAENIETVERTSPTVYKSMKNTILLCRCRLASIFSIKYSALMKQEHLV